MEEELIRQGLISHMDDNFTTAIDQFSKALEKNTNNYNALIFRGCSYTSIGDYTSALKDFASAENLNPNNVDFDLLYNRGKAYFYNFDFKSAEADLTKAKEVDGITSEQKSKVEDILKLLS